MHVVEKNPKKTPVFSHRTQQIKMYWLHFITLHKLFFLFVFYLPTDRISLDPKHTNVIIFAYLCALVRDTAQNSVRPSSPYSPYSSSCGPVL